MTTKIDVVYSWVDDTWPGYMSILKKHGKPGHDFNPNRTRDNLQMLKYSLRSLDILAPWVGDIYIVTMRPQVPAWLDISHPRIHVIHHDEFIPEEDLPTFSSLSITANLHRLPINSERFIYFEDDMMLLQPIALSSFVTTKGQMRVFPRLGRSIDEKHWQKEGWAPWDLAVSNSNRLLNQAYGRKSRSPVIRAPLYLEKSWWAEMWKKWPKAFKFTSASKFRTMGNIAPEHLFPYFCLGTGKAIEYSRWKTHQLAGYIGLENSRWLNRLGFLKISMINPSFIVMNDNFGHAPKPKVVEEIQKALQNQFPNPSQFEKT